MWTEFLKPVEAKEVGLHGMLEALTNGKFHSEVWSLHLCNSSSISEQRADEEKFVGSRM